MAGIKTDNNFQSKLKSLITKTIEEEQKMEGNLDFLLDNNVNKKNNKKKKTKIKQYNTTKIKSRNFLANISCNRVTEEDLLNKVSFQMCTF